MTCPADLARTQAENPPAAAIAAGFDPSPDRIAATDAAAAPFEPGDPYGPTPDPTGPLYLYDRTPGRPARSRLHRLRDAETWPARCRERRPGTDPEPEIRR